MNLALIFILGVFLGGNIGLLAASLCVISGKIKTDRMRDCE